MAAMPQVEPIATSPADTLRPVPVLTIDGPTASGKGSVAERVGAALGFHVLDSGALYRLAALAAERRGIASTDERALAVMALDLDIRFTGGRILLEGKDATNEIRDECIGNAASAIAVLPPLRAALLDRQRAFRQAPGLVADGRDMGTVVFPDAALKVFLVASPEARAKRRHKQLIEKGISANIDVLLRELRDRDARDAARKSAPLAVAVDAVTIDTSLLGVDEVVERILELARQKGFAFEA